MEKQDFKSGFVNIIGNPNVGKSTLMNKLIGERLSIITSKAQTTRHRILGIVNDELGAKILFEPGFESNFSGMFGMNKLDNNWIITGELNLQM